MNFSKFLNVPGNEVDSFMTKVLSAIFSEIESIAASRLDKSGFLFS